MSAVAANEQTGPPSPPPTVSVKIARDSAQTQTKDFSSLNNVTPDSNEGKEDSQVQHYLLLARQWDDSEETEIIREQLHEHIKDGNLDSAARIVGRYNAEKTADAAKWDGAKTNTSKYMVQPSAVVNLRARPDATSPRTGFTIKPRAVFSSEREVLDKEGNLWIKVAYKRIEDQSSIVSPQGWTRVRPGGDGTTPIVKRITNCLKCFGCGTRLMPVVSAQDKYDTVNPDKVTKGDTVFVAANLEKVQIQSCEKGKTIGCTFVNTMEDTTGSVSDGEDTNASRECDPDSLIWYRACDLVIPKSDSRISDGIDECIPINGRLRSRRELILTYDGDEWLARKAWDGADKDGLKSQEFASCARGHLLHARCLQKALVEGSRCPAPGCMEQLYLPIGTQQMPCKISTMLTREGGKPLLYKIVLLGDSGVGKTSLVARLTNPDRPMDRSISATMGIEFDTQMLDSDYGRIKAQIWDTAGQERFARVLLPTYFRRTKGVILIYDITDASSFESLRERWMRYITEFHTSDDDLAKLLVGNKSDLEANREVSQEKAEQFCAEYGMEMLETSANSGENVLNAFEKFIGIVHNNVLEAYVG